MFHNLGRTARSLRVIASDGSDLVDGNVFHAVDFASETLMDLTVAFVRRKLVVVTVSLPRLIGRGGMKSVYSGYRSSTLSTRNEVVCENMVLQRRNVVVLCMRCLLYHLFASLHMLVATVEY